jgi:hypothetical protein
MRASRVIAGIAVGMVCILGLFWLLSAMLESHYIRLQHKSPAYYAEPAANKPDAVNPAMTIWPANKDHWRRVADAVRSR